MTEIWTTVPDLPWSKQPKRGCGVCGKRDTKISLVDGKWKCRDCKDGKRD
jgi:hypothetical protein